LMMRERPFALHSHITKHTLSQLIIKASALQCHKIVCIWWFYKNDRKVQLKLFKVPLNNKEP
jgi:hypothetical protein